MASEPKSKVRPRIEIEFQLGNLAGKDYGYLFRSFEFKGMVNNGYIIRAKLFDAHYNLLNALIEEGYFKETRKRPVPVRFRIKSGDAGRYPESATRTQTAILLSLDVVGGPEDVGNIEFIAIDPPSWFLNMGDAAGSVWKGRVDQVIRKVVQQYAPGVGVDVSRTTDSEENKWWMMRQDPKTFLGSLMDWSSSITLRKTQWLVEMDGYDMSIKEQGLIQSTQRAFYRYFDTKDMDTIREIGLRADNALSVVQTKLIAQGTGAISGQYLDRITDQGERSVFVKDQRTENKQIARITGEQGFTKPPDAGPPLVGWTSISSIPEIYSAGDLGVQYEDYIDGRPRAMWLNMTNALLRVKFTVLGHGEWSECRGMGVDTVFVKWTAGKKDGSDADSPPKKWWWITGNWIIYGFHHRVDRSRWMTDLYCARFDWDAAAQKVGGGGE
jgi:hypothetical protein